MRFLEVTQIVQPRAAPKRKKKPKPKMARVVTEAAHITMRHVGTSMDANFDYKGALNQFKIIPTLCIDYESIDLLSLRRDIEWYLDALEIRRFVELSHPTYEKLTHEFLSTVTLAYPESNDVKAKEEILASSISENSYALSVDELCEPLGFLYHDHIPFTMSEASYGTLLRFPNEEVMPGISNKS